MSRGGRMDIAVAALACSVFVGILVYLDTESAVASAVGAGGTAVATALLMATYESRARRARAAPGKGRPLLLRIGVVGLLLVVLGGAIGGLWLAVAAAAVYAVGWLLLVAFAQRSRDR
jgi:hypothetical protein